MRIVFIAFGCGVLCLLSGCGDIAGSSLQSLSIDPKFYGSYGSLGDPGRMTGSDRVSNASISWLDNVPPLRTGDRRSFQFRAHIDTGSELLVAYVSWAFPDRRCVILCDRTDGLPLMIAVDGKVWLYDVIGGQILLIRAEPELILRVHGAEWQGKWGMRADFPDRQSLTTIHVDFASTIKFFSRKRSEPLSIDNEKRLASFKRKGLEATLEAAGKNKPYPTSFVLKIREGGRHVTLEFDSFIMDAPLPSWHKSIDRIALSKLVPVLAVAEKNAAPPDVQKRLRKFKALARGGGLFILRPSLRDDDLRRAIEKNSPIKFDFKQMKANDERLKQVWRDALKGQSFELPGPNPSLDDMNRRTMELHRKGKYAEALTAARKTLELAERDFGDSKKGISVSLNNLATVYESLGKYAQAEPLFKRALAIREKFFGKNHPGVVNTMNNLAVFYNSQKKYAEAEALFNRALSVLQRTSGGDTLEVADVLNNLGTVYRALGKYEKAEPLLKRALAISEKTLGRNHPNVADTLKNLADLYLHQGKYAQAEPFFNQALAVIEKALGREHPRVASYLNNLGGLYLAKGKYAQAEALLMRALAISGKALGEEHPFVLRALENLAVCLKAQGKMKEAEKVKEQAKKIRARIEESRSNTPSPQTSSKAESPPATEAGAAAGKAESSEDVVPAPGVPATGK